MYKIRETEYKDGIITVFEVSRVVNTPIREKDIAVKKLSIFNKFLLNPTQEEIFELVYGGIPTDREWAIETIVYKETIKKFIRYE